MNVLAYYFPRYSSSCFLPAVKTRVNKWRASIGPRNNQQASSVTGEIKKANTLPGVNLNQNVLSF
jgi:hypothetical protein